MTLRLVLVSLVAALGLTIPGGPTIENWVATTQNWMNARFADWDTRNPQESDYVIITDTYDVETLAPRPPSLSDETPPIPPAIELASAEVKTPAVLPAVAAPAPRAIVRTVSTVRRLASFTPIVVAGTDQPGIALADELNRRNDGVGMAPPKAARRSPEVPRFVPLFAAGSTYAAIALETSPGLRSGPSASPAAARPAPASAKPGAAHFTPLAVADNYCSGIAFELNRRNEGLDIKQVAVPVKPAAVQAPAVVSLPTFGAMETSESLYFAGPLEPARPSITLAAPRIDTPGRTITPVALLDEGEELYVEVAGELMMDRDGFAAVRPTRQGAAPRSELAPVAVADRKFEPIEVGEDFYVGVAHELNRRNDGIGVPVTAVSRAISPPVGPPAPTRELSQAVKLTREAVHAWVSVLTGPALVTVSK